MTAEERRQIEANGLPAAEFQREAKRQMEVDARETFWRDRHAPMEFVERFAVDLVLRTEQLARELEVFDPRLTPRERTLAAARRLYARLGLVFPTIS